MFNWLNLFFFDKLWLKSSFSCCMVGVRTESKFPTNRTKSDTDKEISIMKSREVVFYSEGAKLVGTIYLPDDY